MNSGGTPPPNIPSIITLLSGFIKNPSKLQHLFFIGPSGSRKTTTAKWFIESFKQQNKTVSALFLNASDERNIESIREKIYPFINCKSLIVSNTNETSSTSKTSDIPRFIVLDEAETLTEPAQLALRPILDIPASEVCVIFLVNCISNINPKLRHRFLKLSFTVRNNTPESSHNSLEKLWENSNLIQPSIIDSFRWRSDLRHFLLRKGKDDNVLNDMIYNILNNNSFKPRVSLQETAIDLIVFAFCFGIIDVSFIKEILQITDPYIKKVSQLTTQTGEKRANNSLETLRDKPSCSFVRASPSLETLRDKPSCSFVRASPSLENIAFRLCQKLESLTPF